MPTIPTRRESPRRECTHHSCCKCSHDWSCACHTTTARRDLVKSTCPSKCPSRARAPPLCAQQRPVAFNESARHLTTSRDVRKSKNGPPRWKSCRFDKVQTITCVATDAELDRPPHDGQPVDRPISRPTPAPMFELERAQTMSDSDQTSHASGAALDEEADLMLASRPEIGCPFSGQDLNDRRSRLRATVNDTDPLVRPRAESPLRGLPDTPKTDRPSDNLPERPSANPTMSDEGPSLTRRAARCEYTEMRARLTATACAMRRIFADSMGLPKEWNPTRSRQVVGWRLQTQKNEMWGRIRNRGAATPTSPTVRVVAVVHDPGAIPATLRLATERTTGVCFA